MATKRAAPTSAPAGTDPQVAAAIEQLTPDEARKVIHLLEQTVKRRKIQLYGYLTGGAVLLVGTIAALVYYGQAEEGTFVGWAFLVPLGLCGLILIAFSRWSDRYRTVLDQPRTPPPS